MRLSLIAFAILIFGQLSCKVKSNSSVLETVEAERPGKRPAVFAFDGTTFKRNTWSVISQFLEGIKIPQETTFYYEGVSLEGSEAYSSVSTALKDLCTGLANRTFDAIFVVGLSRGAIEAVSFVNRAETTCGQKVPFYWLGLVDPVNTLIEDLPTVLPGAAELPCLLVRKEKNFEHIFTTKMIGLCNTSVVSVPNIGHAAISFDEDVGTLLKLSARDLGRNAFQLEYEAYSKYFQSAFAPDSESRRCRLFQGEAQECLSARCQYDLQGGICQPLKVK